MVEGLNVLGYGELEPEQSITDMVIGVAAIIILYLALLPVGIINTTIVMLEILMILWYKSTGFLTNQMLIISALAFLVSADMLIGGNSSIITNWLFKFSGTSQIAIMVITALSFSSVLVIWIFANARHTLSTVLAFGIAALVAFQTFNVNYTIHGLQEQFSKVGFTQEYYDNTLRDIHHKLRVQSDLISIPADIAIHYMIGIKATESWAVFNEFIDSKGNYQEILELAEESSIEPDKLLHMILSDAKSLEFPYEEFIKTTYAVKEVQMKCNIEGIPFGGITVNSPATLGRLVRDTVSHPASFNWARTQGQFSWEVIPSYTITYEITPNTLKLYTEEEFNQIDRSTYDKSLVYIHWAIEQYKLNLK